MADLFLRACRRQPVERAPLWIMRQAGRYLPEYREVRERFDFLTLCKTPELAAKVTLQPIERFGFDAAILFSDIMVPAGPMGFDVRFDPGPKIDRPVRSAEDVRRIRIVDPEEHVGFVFETIRILRRELQGRVPLIGFAAAPFTLAAYLVEGSGSRQFERIKSMLFAEPALARQMLDRVAQATELYIAAQIRAGAQAIQLFDTWAGLLAVDEFREFALDPVRRLIDTVREAGVPAIYFALDAAHLYDEIAGCGADVVGVDWRTGLDVAGRRLGDGFALQGNLDPCALLAPPEVVRQRALRVLDRAAGLPGHIFNLGHGILPGTPIDSVESLVRTVHGRSIPAAASEG